MKRRSPLKLVSVLMALILCLSFPLMATAASKSYVSKQTVSQKGKDSYTVNVKFYERSRYLEFTTTGSRFDEVGLPYLATSHASKQNRIAANALGDPVSFAVSDLVLNETIDQVTYVIDGRRINYYYDLGANKKVAEITNDTTTLYELRYDNSGNITEILDKRYGYCYTFDKNGNCTGKWNEDKSRKMTNANMKYTASFDSSNRLTKWVDNDEVTVTFKYNNGGLASVHETDGSFTMDYTYTWKAI